MLLWLLIQAYPCVMHGCYKATSGTAMLCPLSRLSLQKNLMVVMHVLACPQLLILSDQNILNDKNTYNIADSSRTR